LQLIAPIELESSDQLLASEFRLKMSAKYTVMFGRDRGGRERDTEIYRNKQIERQNWQ
jgi:hypothetical protein